MTDKPNSAHLRSIIAALVFVLVPIAAIAQSELWYTSDRALSSSLIKKIIHDRNDIIWIATENGLNRFDGSKFVAFHNIPGDSLSLASEFVNSVFEDDKGNLFVCSHKGVQVYDDATQRFSAPLHLKGRGPYTGAASDMLRLANGEIWVVGNDILRVIEDGRGGYMMENVPQTDGITYIHRGIADHTNNVWLTESTGGVIRVSTDGNTRRYFTDENAPVFETFAIGADNTLYAGSQGSGLYRYDRDTDRFVKIDLGQYGDVKVMDIYPDEYGNIFVATDGNGLLVYRMDRGVTWTFQIPNVDYSKLKVHSVDKDQYGNLWIGVYQKGILKVPERSAFFSSINQRNNSNIVGSSSITSLVRDDDGTLWVGTDNDGVYAVGRWLTSSRHFSDGVPQVVMALFEDSKGNLWVGSYGQGAGILDKASGAFRSIPLPGTSVDAQKVYDFVEEKDGDILIATMGDGIYRHSAATGRTERIGKDGTYNKWVSSMDLCAPDGKIAAGTYNGLYIVDTDGSAAEHLLDGVIVYTVKYDHMRHRIWAGTNDGIVEIDGNLNVVANYGSPDGLPGKSVYAIEDDGQYLWLSTNHGLSRMDPRNGTFTNFTVADGLPNNEFSKDASFRDSNGTMYFGGINGIATFKPADITVGGRNLTLRITDFFLAGNPVTAGTLSGGKPIIEVPVYEAETFRLSHDDNTFSVRFNTKEMVDASTSEYYYSFDDSEWTKVTENNEMFGGATLTFTNVPSGKHILRIKALENGVESDALAVNIEIDYPWYASWWMKILYVLLALVLIGLVYRHVSARNRRRREEMQRRHHSEIMEAKLRFFTDISHEIRTPLSLVLGPVQKLMNTDTDADRQYSYRTILRNGKRILRLVNELMDLRKIDNNQMKLRYTRVDLIGFVNDLYETFLPSARTKGVDLQFVHPDFDTLEAWVDKSNFDKILMNLLSNALKFTPKGGKVEVAVTTAHNPESKDAETKYACISVTDTGIGIEKSDREEVFNRFFQARNNTSGGGTGIGLHLTHQLVELHHGTISVDENPEGRGTRFTVYIPLGDNHIQESEKVPDAEGAFAMLQETETADADNSLHIPAVDEDTDTVQMPEEARQRKFKETVFVVEDDKEILRYIADNVGRYYKVCTYGNGKEALDAIHEKKPDLVITDVMMPEMDGMTLTKKIKQNININHIPVIILTAKTREEDNIEAMECGAAAFITKPFNIDVLVKTVKNQIDANQRLRNTYSGKQSHEDKVEEIKVVSNDEKLMERVMREINKNLSNSDITVEMIAQNIGISRVHLHRKLKELTNQSTRDFIRNIRLQAAARMLREKKLSVSEVSDMVGFKQPNNFSTCFKDMFGMSPTAYCAKYHNKDNKSEVDKDE